MTLRARGLMLERLEPRLVLAGEVLISELMADNTLGHADEDGDFSDWIEIYNAGGAAQDLGGWHLTDDAENLTKWTIPDGVTLQGGAWLVVFASGKDRRAAGDELHTSFGLKASGEYLALVNDSLIVEHQYAPFPKQFADVSYGIKMASPLDVDALEYFQTPTPGMANTEPGVLGFVKDTSFSTDRGFFKTSEAFDLVISSDTPEAMVYYTTDGSRPEASNPTAAVFDTQAPLHIDRTSTIRAAAYKAGFVPSNVDTQTYIFLDDVIRQSPSGEAPPLWPTGSVNGQVFNYGMDPDIVNDPEWGPQLRAALESVSTISMVIDLDDLVDPTTGFYVHARGQGKAWERPASIELIRPDGSQGFQIDAGVRPRGNYSAAGSNPKHAFRFFFREEYGDKWLDYPLFGDEGVDRFRKLDLRTVQNDSWPFQASTEMTFLLDVYARDLQRYMGQPYTRSRYHHLYINGQYWGLYQTQERSEQHYGESYLGGDDDNYDVIKATGGPLYQTEATAGTTDAWRDLWTQARTIWANPSDENYLRVQGLNPGGTRNPDYPVLVDVDNLMDFMIGIFYTGDEDRGLSLPFGNDRPNNYFAARDREGERGFVFFAQDAEQGFESWHNVHGLFANRVGPFFDSNQDDFRYSNPQWIHQDLSAHPDYRRRFADRIHKYMFNDGLLTPSGVIAGLQTRADEIDLAIIAESARWGDGHPSRTSNPFTKQDWVDNIQDLYNIFIPQRGDIVLGQLRRAGLYPNVTAPQFNQHGGDVPVGFDLTMHVPDLPANTPIYYTTDGVTDPRAADGSIAGVLYTGSITINDSRLVQARSLVDGEWSALNSSQFTVAGADASNLRVSEIMYHPSAPTEEEIARLATQTLDKDDFEFIELRNISEAAISLVDVSFSNGVKFSFSGSNVTSLEAGQRVLVVRNQAAFAARYGDALDGLIAGEFVNTALSNGGETLTLIDRFGQTIERISYKDGWFGITDGEGFSLTRRDESDAAADPNSSDAWRPSSDLGGSPGEADSLRAPLPEAVVINEVLSHTDGSLGDRIELLNTADAATGAAIDLGGWFLSDDRAELKKFRIPDGTSIPAGGYVVFDGLGANGFSTPGASGATNPFALSESGDRLLLSAATPAGELLGFREDVDFGAADREVAFGRHVKSTGGKDIVAMSVNTFGGPNALPMVGPVVIHEIMYNAATGARTDEFVELRNITGAAVSLAGWKIGGGIDMLFSAGTTIPAGGLLLITPTDPVDFRATHGVSVGAIVVGPYDGALSNSGESVTLRKPGETEPDGAVPMILVDRIKYNDQLPWSEEADGGGPALQRDVAAEYGNDSINWTASFPGGTPGDFAVPPQVTEVLVRGSVWPAEVLAALSAGGLGQGGFSIRGGNEQLRSIPWQNVDQVLVRFSEAVTVTTADFSLIGVNTSRHDVIAFDYDAEGFTATWTLASPLAADKILLEVSGAVHDVNGLPLDGHWDTGNTFPSGDGAIGSDQSSEDAFRFRLNVLPGDVTADEVVDRRDVLALLRGLGAGIDEERYDGRLDVKLDGQVDLFDLREVLRRLPSRLPSDEPSDTGDEPARVAVDAVFERLGNAPSPAAAVARRDVHFRSLARRSSAPRISSTGSVLHRLQATAIDRAIAEESGSPLRSSTLWARTARRLRSRTAGVAHD